MLKAERILKSSAELGEGALWDEKRQRLWWVDINAPSVHCFDPATGKDESKPVPDQVGTVVTEEGASLALALKNGFYRFDWESGKVEELATLELGAPYIRFNDGKCDPQGRFWAGTMALGARPGAGNLFCLERDLSVSRKIKSVTISNGLGWSADGSKMFYIDTPTHRVMEFAFEGSSGSISSPRIAMEIPESEGAPDGLCMDAEGMIWVALWGGSKVIRLDPATGKKLEEVLLPGIAQVTSCALGGAGMKTLFITTARERFTPKDEAEQPDAGSLFAAPVSVKGLPSHAFKPLKS